MNKLLMLLGFMVGPGLAPIAVQNHESVKVEAVEVLASIPEVSIPRAKLLAPNWSPEQTASNLCGAKHLPRQNISGLNKPLNEARAHDATIAARQVRRDAARGRATMAQVEAAEIARAKAFQGRVFHRTDWFHDFATPGLAISDFRFEPSVQYGQSVIILTGGVTNATRRAIELPPLNYWAADDADYVLDWRDRLLEKETLAPGETWRFQVRYVNSPAYAVTFGVFFGNWGAASTDRSCDFFDPLTLRPNELAAAILAGGPEGTDRAMLGYRNGKRTESYTAPELDRLYRWRHDAGYQTFNEENKESTELETPRPTDAPIGCYMALEYLAEPWRESMHKGDLAQDAWFAVWSAAKARADVAAGFRTEAQAATVERAAAEAIRTFHAAATAPERPGLTLENARVSTGSFLRPLGVAQTLRTPTGDRIVSSREMGTIEDLYIHIEGFLRPTDGRPVKTLMLTIHDRFGAALARRVVKPKNPVPPAGAAFTFNWAFAEEFPADMAATVSVQRTDTVCPKGT